MKQTINPLTGLFDLVGEGGFGVQVVSELPEQGEEGVIYIVINGGTYVRNNNQFIQISEEQKQSDWTQTDANAVDYIKHKPTIPPAQVQSDWAQTDVAAVDYIRNKPQLEQIQSDWDQTDASALDYIKNKPTIPTVNDATLTIRKNGTDVQTFTANSSDNKVADIAVPTKVSDLNNDLGFITNTVNNLLNYYLKSETYTKTEVNELLGQISTLHFEVVQTLPASGQSNVIYLLEVVGGYDQYIWTNNTWIKIGTTNIDLSNYIQKTENLLNINGTNYKQGDSVTQAQADWNEADNTQVDYIKNKPTIPAAQIQSDWNQSDNSQVDYIKNKPTIPAAQIQSDWNQSNSAQVDFIKNKPTIPTNTSDLNNDSGFITGVQAGAGISVSGTTITNTGVIEETVYSGDTGTRYSIKTSNSAPAAGTPNTTITFVLDPQ